MTDCALYAAAWITHLPMLNAALNLTALLLLLAGYGMIKRGHEQLHKRSMLAAFVTSILFLVSYLVYHQQAGHVPFVGPPAVRRFYLAMLASHVVLAAVVPLLAIVTIYLGLRERRGAHRRLAHWTFPIWLYVSATGVAIYLMVYHLYPASPSAAKMKLLEKPPAQRSEQPSTGPSPPFWANDALLPGSRNRPTPSSVL